MLRCDGTVLTLLKRCMMDVLVLGTVELQFNLSRVLGPLADSIGANAGLALSSLDLPLQRCVKTCEGFEQELVQYSARTDGGRTSFQEWTKSSYMGDYIETTSMTSKDHLGGTSQP